MAPSTRPRLVSRRDTASVRRCGSSATLRSLIHDLNARGVTTSVGGQWNRTTLRAVLASARISGRREYKPSGAHNARKPTGDHDAPPVLTVRCPCRPWRH
ncbi:MAG: recombinase family protein [Pseudonocardiaceae bacterium]